MSDPNDHTDVYSELEQILLEMEWCHAVKTESLKKTAQFNSKEK